jgi:hypothetical protein
MSVSSTSRTLGRGSRYCRSRTTQALAGSLNSRRSSGVRNDGARKSRGGLLGCCFDRAQRDVAAVDVQLERDRAVRPHGPAADDLAAHTVGPRLP